MRILGIDLATLTGWCLVEVVDGGSLQLVASSTIDATVKKKAEPELFKLNTLMGRAVRMHQELKALLERTRPDIVAFEHVQFSKFALAHAAWNQFFAAALLACHETGRTDLCLCAVGAIKKFATGSGNADKAAMIKALRVRFGPRVDGWDDNQVDAAWVAIMGATRNGHHQDEQPEHALPAAEADRPLRRNVRRKGHNRRRAAG